MSRLYGPSHRDLQDEFDSRRMADRIETIAVKPELDDMARAFIESRDMFFLSSIDHQGRPTVSYKGGDAGFVRVVDAGRIAFPSYDGNGMYFSMGNIAANPEIGCLFIDFERPFRLRLQGRAELVRSGPLLGLFKEAELVVSVAVSDVWMNCPRYVHRYQKIARSRYVPAAGAETPLCEWKRIDMLADALPAKDVPKVASAGSITIDDWMGKVMTGDEGV
ncbi:MAG: pyridoxamine 5'-phosphate oxidase family protein [Hyphomicrobium sp.]